MIPAYKKSRLEFITIVYWVMLLFIMAAWVWWFVSLQNQNNQMRYYKLLQLNKDDVAYNQKLFIINDEHSRKTGQYISEGITFVLVTLVGALFVYRSVKKQFHFNRQQQNFMMAVTHELKTPIAVIMLSAETLQKRKLEEEKQQRLMHTILQEGERLNDLASNILVTSQLENNYIPDAENIDFSELADKAALDFSNRFPNRIIKKNIEPGIYIYAERLLIQLLINNILDNALKYSPREKPVNLKLNRQQNKAVLCIADEGSGIIDEEKKKVFDKFYRSGNESIRNTKGTGLGLYLCRRIAESFKGKIKISDNNPSGSVFIIEFKAA